MSVDMTTEELKRLAESITPGPWYAHETHPQNACAYVSARREFMDHEIATLYHAESDNAGQDEAGIWSDQPERRANARAIALVPALLREVLAHRKAEAWQPIETAPHETLVVVGWYEGDVWKQEIALASAGTRYPNGCSDRWQHGRASHWRPLPVPPAAPEADGGSHDR